MRGHITQRAKGSWSIKVSIGKDNTTGKYKYQWFTVKGGKKNAEKRLSEILHQLDTGSYMKPGKTTLTEYLERWLADYARANLSPRGYDRYRDICQRCINPVIGNLPLTQLKAGHLQKCYSDWQKKGLSPATIRYHHAVMHKALATALKWGLVTRNVADGVEAPRIKRSEMTVWNEQELSTFLEAARGSQYHELFYLALFTGMRRSELLALRWLDIDFILGQVYVSRGLHQLKDGSFVFTQPKSVYSRRSIALPPSTVLLLQGYYDKQCMDATMLNTTVKDDDLIFSTLDGQPLRPNTITRAWQSVVARSCVKRIRLHDARHTHASLMLKQGVHPKIVQERLGHGSIQITLDTYSHVAPGLQQMAAQSFDNLVKALPQATSSILVANSQKETAPCN